MLALAIIANVMVILFYIFSDFFDNWDILYAFGSFVLFITGIWVFYAHLA
jgi:hypothetical protein